MNGSTNLGMILVGYCSRVGRVRTGACVCPFFRRPSDVTGLLVMLYSSGSDFLWRNLGRE
jgi:hypothetical protein